MELEKSTCLTSGSTQSSRQYGTGTETEDRISEVEDKMVEINEAERKKEKRI